MKENIYFCPRRASGLAWPYWVVLVAVSWVMALAVAGATDGPVRLEQLGPRNEPVDLARYQRILYVHRDVNEAELGGRGTRQAPWNSVQHAVDMIRDAGPGNRYAVLVARGTYAVQELALKPYVDLYGGFNPEDWSREIFTNVTVLEGGGAARILIGADNAVLDGFTVEHGSSDGPGGALLCRDVAPRITNNIITACGTRSIAPGVGGGGIACLDGAAPEITRNIISYCVTAAGPGGGIVCDGGSSPHIAGNIIFGNVTALKAPASGVGAPGRLGNGGGIACLGGSSPRIIDNVIASNLAGGKSDGGGLFCVAGAAPVVNNNAIAGNVSENCGGGVAALRQADPQLRDNMIIDNDAAMCGGGLYLEHQGASPIVNNVIACNTTVAGGGVACVDAALRLVNNTICDNHAGQGGAIYFLTTGQTMQPMTVVNCILWNNAGAPAIYHKGGDVRPQINHCLVQEPTEGTGNIMDDPRFVPNDIEGQVSSMALDPARSRTQLRVIFDQRFPLAELPGRVIRVGSKCSVIAAPTRTQWTAWGDLSGGLNLAPTAYAVFPSYHLGERSPCLGAGTAKGAPTTDISGRQRRTDKVDMGAWERPWVAVVRPRRAK